MGSAADTCEACDYNVFYDGGDGFRYCDRCHEQDRSFRETGEDEDDVNAFFSHNASMIISQSQPQPQPDPTPMDDAKEGPSDFGSTPGAPEVPSDDDIRLRYALGFQIMLDLQVKALVDKCSVSPLVVGLARDLWFQLLAVRRVLADHWKFCADSLILGEATMPGKRDIMSWLTSKLPLSYSLAISFLACHLAREPVLPTDILKWAAEGKLPYIHAYIEIENQIGAPSRALPVSMFRPIRMTSSKELEACAALIVKETGLKEPPPVNFYGLTSRFLVELSIPHSKILQQACRVYEWCMAPDLFLLGESEAILPTRVYVMAVLIVTIRFLYDLNGWGAWEMSLSTSESSSSAKKKRPLNSTFASDDYKGSSSSLYENSTDDELVALLKVLYTQFSEIRDIHDYSKDLSSYLDYCNNVVFANSSASDLEYVEEKLIESLWEIYETKRAKQLEDEEMQPEHKDQTTTQSSMDELGVEAIRKLKLDMEDNGFLYIPPRKPSKKMGYLYYPRRIIDQSKVFACHADYYILLRACARVAQVDLRILHLGVTEFERRLKKLEGRIEQCFLEKHSPISDGEAEGNDNLE